MCVDCLEISSKLNEHVHADGVWCIRSCDVKLAPINFSCVYFRLLNYIVLPIIQKVFALYNGQRLPIVGEWKKIF